jgi:hypothetical protein
MTNKLETIKKLEMFFENAENGISKIDNEIKGMEGMTGIKTRHFYNNLLTIEDSRYLEIGTWKGSSVCSAMCGNSSKILCVDNWSEFGGPKEEFLNNFEKYKGRNQATYIEVDCFSIDVNSIGKYNIYMYDGNHTYESHYKSLTYFIDSMEDEFILIVDDWNWEQVRSATNNSITDLNLTTLWSKEIKLNENNETTHDRDGWWNGIAVFLLKK